MTDYFLDNSGANGSGSSNQPFNNTPDALAALQAGDRLRIRTGSSNYTDWPSNLSNSAYSSGTSSNPIVITADEGHDPILSHAGDRNFVAMSYWTFLNLRHEQCAPYALGNYGSTNDACEGFKWSACIWENCSGNAAVLAKSTKVVCTMENCQLTNIRTRVAGGNASYGMLMGIGDDYYITGNRFTDLGGESVQVPDTALRGTVYYLNNITETRRPYIYYDEFGVAPNPDPNDPQQFGNVGENGIDCKGSGTGHILIDGNTFTGFRPSDSSVQDTSGSLGAAVKYNRNVQSMHVTNNYFDDNTIHIAAANARSDVYIAGNLFGDVTYEDTAFPRSVPVGLQLDNISGDYTIEDNSFIQVEQDNAFSLMSMDRTMQDLTLRNNAFSGAKILDDSNSTSNFTCSNNAWETSVGTVPASLQGAGDVVDADLEIAQPDYRPGATSPLQQNGYTTGKVFDYYQYPISVPQPIGAVQPLEEIPTTFSNDGDLPPGVTFHPSDVPDTNIKGGDYSGLVTTPGVYNMVTTAKNVDGESAQSWTWTVQGAGVKRSYEFDMDEQTGTVIENTDPSTLGDDGSWDVEAYSFIPNNSRLLPMNDGPGSPVFKDVLNTNPMGRRWIQVGDGVMTGTVPEYDLTDTTFSFAILYEGSDQTLFSGSDAIMSIAANQLVGGPNVTNITLQGNPYTSQALELGETYSITCDISTGTLTTVGPLATGTAVGNLSCIDSEYCRNYPMDEESGTEFKAYDANGNELGNYLGLPIYDTWANFGDGVRYGVLEQPIVLEGDFEISWEGIREDSASGTGTVAFFGQLPSNGTNRLRLYDAASALPSRVQVSGSGANLNDDTVMQNIAIGQHYKGVLRKSGGPAYVEIDGVQGSAVSDIGSFIVECFYFGGLGSQLPANSALQNIVIKDLTKGLTWDYGLDEGSGTDIINSSEDTQGNYLGLPLFDTDGLAQDNTRTIGIPAFDFSTTGTITVDAIYADGTILDGSVPVLTGVAGVITAGANVSNITVNGDTYAGETIPDGQHISIGFDVSAGTVTTIGPIATGAIANVVLDSTVDFVDYKVDDGGDASQLAVKAYDRNGDEIGLSGNKLTTFTSFSVGITVAAGVNLDFNSSVLNGRAEDVSLPIETGTRYRVTYTVSEYVEGSVSVRVGNTHSATQSSNGTYVETVTASTTEKLEVYGRSASNTFKITGVVIEQYREGTITPDAAWEYIPEYSNNGQWVPDTEWTYVPAPSYSGTWSAENKEYLPADTDAVIEGIDSSSGGGWTE